VSGVSAESIRRAISSGDCSRALELWNQYAADLRRKLTARLLSAAELTEAGELIAWSRPVVLSVRAHARDRLHALMVAGAYGCRAAPRSYGIRARF